MDNWTQGRREGNVTQKMERGKWYLSRQSNGKRLAVKDRSRNKPGHHIKEQSSYYCEPNIARDTSLLSLKIPSGPYPEETKSSGGKKSVHSERTGKDVINQNASDGKEKCQCSSVCAAERHERRSNRLYVGRAERQKPK